jgi:hypothetical protein
MANTPAMCNSFKNELLTGQHNFGVGFTRAATTVDTIKAALYLTTATIDNTTTIYSSLNEISAGTVSYTAGGNTVTNATAPVLSTNTACWTPSAPIVWNNLTAPTAFNTVLLYNVTNGNKAIASYGIGSQTITAGTLTLTMPSNVAGSALINIA